MNKIPLYYYIAFNNPDGAKSVIESFGYEIYNVRDRNDLAQCVKQLIQERGEDALAALAKVHPDRDLILSEADTPKALSANGDTKLLDAPAATPALAQQPSTNHTSDYTPVLLAGMFLSALVITAAIIVKK